MKITHDTTQPCHLHDGDPLDGEAGSLWQERRDDRRSIGDPVLKCCQGSADMHEIAVEGVPFDPCAWKYNSIVAEVHGCCKVRFSWSLRAQRSNPQRYFRIASAQKNAPRNDTASLAYACQVILQQPWAEVQDSVAARVDDRAPLINPLDALYALRTVGALEKSLPLRQPVPL